MKQGWSIKSFGDCIEKVKATTKLQSSLYKDSGTYPIVSQEKELISGYWDIKEDLFCHSTPLVVFGDHTMVVKYIDFDFVVGADGVKILMPKPFLLPKFFYYWVSSVQIQSRGYARHFRYLKETSVPIPSQSEQQRIVDILDAEFAKIDALKENAEKNLQNAKDLFQAVLRRELYSTYTQPLVDVCLGIVDCPHSTPKKSTKKTEYPCIRTSELGKGEILWSTMQYVDEDEYLKRIGRMIPQYEDIVYGREGTIGNAVLIPKEHNFCLGQRTTMFRPNKDIVDPKYLLYAILSPYVYDQAMMKNNGCGVAHVNVADIKQFRIPMKRTIAEQQRVVGVLDRLNTNCKILNENFLKTMILCDDLKQALLRKAFNGEL